ncbi:hypothetical protein, partial [Mesorhizobium sp. P5_C1]
VPCSAGSRLSRVADQDNRRPSTGGSIPAGQMASNDVSAAEYTGIAPTERQANSRIFTIQVITND